jgi:hypothetical protein
MKCLHCGREIDAYVKWPYYRHADDRSRFCEPFNEETEVATPERENP